MKLTNNASTAATTILALAVAAALGGIAPTALALKENCIESADLPLTIYEAAEMSPQNMDFDMENNVRTAYSIVLALLLVYRMDSYLCTKYGQGLERNPQS